MLNELAWCFVIGRENFEMTMTPGTTYQRNRDLLYVYFIDIGGTAWGQLSNGCAMYVFAYVGQAWVCCW